MFGHQTCSLVGRLNGRDPKSLNVSSLEAFRKDGARGKAYAKKKKAAVEQQDEDSSPGT